ncbi:hypothetical protein HK100_012016 [Physocladia obscura]|uniref:PFU domain-containing protein n=1 Tax=Physocladia obscura TaxID=109957 RepID=A0AAD5T0E6_9FUNG|nr:hypothetical protein HK100_012016 [Physocladia obscura]
MTEEVEGKRKQYRLRAQLSGHSQDVRGVAALGESGGIVSVSRDTKVLQWIPVYSHEIQSQSPLNTLSHEHESSQFLLYSTRLGHSHFVSAVVFVPPTPEFPQGLIASGSADKTILVFDAASPADAEPIFMLVGHSDNVCALAFDASGVLISGSWDRTAKVWRNWECAFTLTGHSQAVWAVLSAGDFGYLTGSADKLIKLWSSDGKFIRNFTGHTDAVRALAPLESVGFLSASNDSTIRVWGFAGDCLAELSSHSSFVYGLTPLPELAGFASCGEDRTVRVWIPDGHEYKCVQTIQHPCTSVWCVAALYNGDIVSGGSDAVVRVFTTREDRFASVEDTKVFDDEVAKQQIPSNQIGDVDKTKLPGLEALQQEGKLNQVIMVRNGDLVEAHQYTADRWVKIGEVVDAVGGGRKQIYAGREYDYVFDIDIGAGQNLKLPYNNDENPYVTAQRFIDTHELPQDFLEQIANFIISNAKPATLGNELDPNFVDPYTGAGRYIPGSAPSATTAKPAVAVPNLFPGIYSTFGLINCRGVKNKIGQLNSDSHKVGGSALSSDELSAVNALLDLIQGGKDKVAKSFDQRYWAAIGKIAFEWPEAVRFPGL